MHSAIRSRARGSLFCTNLGSVGVSFITRTRATVACPHGRAHHQTQRCSHSGWAPPACYMQSYPALPAVPSDVQFSQGTFVNAQGLRLATFSYVATPKPRGIVFLLHGYGVYTQYEFLLPPSPGEPHTQFEESVIDRCVRAGWAVHALDHQGHGRSEGAGGLQASFERFSNLPDEASDYIDTLLADDQWKGLPVFLWSVSMGGATALSMARKKPEAYAGLVLYAPMISLELVRQVEVGLGIRNADLEPLVGILSLLLPHVPVAKPARNTVNPLAQEEFDNDPLIYHGAVRNRVSEEFINVCDGFLRGGLFDVRTPFVTYHSVKDTFTDPYGSKRLFEMASTEDKTYVRVGKGLDIDADVWHALTTEVGRDEILSHSLAWIDARSKR
jgi:alpha-beta hydrolase superfamily lysophospholipase